MEVEPLYQIQVTCIQCESTFQTSRIRPSFKKAKRSDTDFCLYFDQRVNPEFYVVRVCPSCGFASTENFSPSMSPAARKEFTDKISKQWTKKNYGGERSWEEALHTYKLALLCAQLKNEKQRVIAGLLHHIAWMYRYKQMEAEERRFMQFALEAYIRVFETEELEDNNARLMYLIGELNRRLTNYNEAVRWFSRVIHDKKIMDAGMIRACREQWMATREDMLAAKLELPEEMLQAPK
ncbi:DUF2225 domain-containing protein [Paenibacillus sp. y28]|uniref:DUF2225 domain-containing protein n=1 Tax=Paenibacillus sp. y28 TaxID=3129110 RepID=UPI003019CC77